MQLQRTNIVRLKQMLDGGKPTLESFADALEGTDTNGGLWRFYFNEWPAGGIQHWNAGSTWKDSWASFLPNGLLAFGEDVFGNQLVLLSGTTEVFLWNHEDGGCAELYLEPTALLETVLKSGIEWVDQYSDGSLEVARQYGTVPLHSHLHWTVPLILGGAVHTSNVSLVERDSHLVGHAKLWSQISTGQE